METRTWSLVGRQVPLLVTRFKGLVTYSAVPLADREHCGPIAAAFLPNCA